MQNLLRELPFFDALGPLLLAGLLWTGAHILFVGPAVGERLAAKTYLPACHAGLKRAQAGAQAAHRMAQAREKAERRAKQEMANRMVGNMMRGVFGREFSNYYRDHPLLNPGALLPDVEALLPNRQAPELPPGAARDYCACVIAEQLGQRVNTGLFSASLRFWKPENITRLENLGARPVSTNACPAPHFISN